MSGYLRAGVPAGKLNVGMPFYGHGWMGVPKANHGLYRSATGPAPHDQAGYNFLKALPGFEHHYDLLSGLAHWIYNADTGTFYSYDDEAAVLTKALYIRSRGLGGAMFWDLTGDDTSGTLVKAVHNGLR